MRVATTPRRLRGDEAIYLYLESPGSAMHCGLLCTLDSRLDADRLRESVAEVVESNLAALRCRVAPAAVGLLHPALVEDQLFDPHLHVREHLLEPNEDVEAVAASLLTPPLDRAHPLWELHVLQGPPEEHAGSAAEGSSGTTTLLFKAHRAIVHEPSGMHLFTLLVQRVNQHDRLRGEDNSSTVPAHELGVPMTTDDELLHGEPAAPSLPAELLRSAVGSALSAFDWMRLASESNRLAFRTLGDVVPNLAWPVPRLPFNRLGSGSRTLKRLTLSYAEARAIRHSFGGSIGDVSLTVVTAALARRLRSRTSGHDLQSKRLRLLCPMPVQLLGEGSTVATTYMPLALPLTGHDLALTYRAVRTQTRTLRAARVPQAIGELLEVVTEWPAPTLRQLTRIHRFTLPCNALFTQAAGPQAALRLQDSTIREIHPINPLPREMGLGVASLSYNQRICFGLRADDLAFPQLEPLREEIRQAMKELKHTADVHDMEPIDVGRPRKRVPTEEIAPTSASATKPSRRPA
jgi:WS/DGAT/MGAT family acyltransferase